MCCGTTGVSITVLGWRACPWGRAAVNLAERHPSLYRFVGSYSGYSDTSSDGMGEAINQAMQEVKPKYSATQMWGPYQSANWQAHDPKLHVQRLAGKSIYVSAGSGNTGPYDKPSEVDGIPQDHAAYALEILAQLTSKTFVSSAQEAGVPVTAKFRPSGTHSWPYWQFEFNQSLPQILKALGHPTSGKVAGDLSYSDSLASFAKSADATVNPKPKQKQSKAGRRVAPPSAEVDGGTQPAGPRRSRSPIRFPRMTPSARRRAIFGSTWMAIRRSRSRPAAASPASTRCRAGVRKTSSMAACSGPRRRALCW
ncbi:MAG: alpha/beta hydrolase-fold protein [Lawsonella clevelandensis]